MDQRNYPPPGQDRSQYNTVEHTTPLWRVVAVVLSAASLAALGFYLERVGHADDFATILVITVVFSISFWAHKRPDRVRQRFGPFGRIADAVRESGDDIRQYIYDRPMRVGFAIAVFYGVCVVLAKYAVVAVLQNLYSWELAVALGAGIGAVAAFPSLFRRAFDMLSDSRRDTSRTTHHSDHHSEPPRYEERSYEERSYEERSYEENGHTNRTPEPQRQEDQRQEDQRG